MMATQYENQKFRTVTENVCAYIGLREWMNENRCGVRQLIALLGFVPSQSTEASWRKRLSGLNELNKTQIDKLLQLTKLTYEEAFREME